MFSRKPSLLIAAGVAAVAIAGGTYGAVAATSSSTPAIAGAASGPAALRGAGNGGSNARSGPAAGGSIGIVSGISKSGFTLVTATGQKVTVDETPTTTYAKGATAALPSVVTERATVLALGTVDGTTVTATQIVVQPSTNGSKTASTVVPFTRGAAGSAAAVGRIPANYQQGSGTIVSGASASKATKAALTAYPGGIVDRVVRLGNGEFEVHNIGVNWPHHIFVDQNFRVVGAN